MKVVVAIDSLKGSLTSIEAGLAIKEGICRVKPDAEVIVKPLADGGEGTSDALIKGLGAQRIDIVVKGPMGQPTSVYYGYLKDRGTAIIEMASASGITLVSETDRNPFKTTTYGTGEIIRDALDRGCRDFIIGIGGSATNDGGIGMLDALGFRFLDEAGNSVGAGGGGALSKIISIDIDMIDPRLSKCCFKIACDVTNPLCGPNGATYIYGPQKGVTNDTRDILDAGMAHYAEIASLTAGNDHKKTAGAGAAGGLGFAFLTFLNGKLTSGIDLILDIVNLKNDLLDADIVITGEGRLDYQTAMGKAPIGVAKLAKMYGLKVIAFAGSVTPDANACNNAGIDAFFPIIREVSTLADAMNPEIAKANMAASAEQVFRLL